MSLIRITCLAALLAAPIAQQASAQEARILPPSSNWILNYDDDSCALQRGFGSEGEAVFFELRQFSPGVGYQVLVVSPDFEVRNERPKVRYGNDEAFWVPPGGSKLDYDDGTGGVVFNDNLFAAEFKAELDDLDHNERNLRLFELARDEAMLAEREASVATISIDDSFGDEITLRTGEMHAPMEAMRECMDDLLTRWGIDAEAHGSLSRPVLPRNYNRLARRVMQNYPSSMLRAGNNARLQVRLAISAEGDVTGCHLQMPIEYDDFREDACYALERASFDPALDADGNPVASYWTNTISYYVR